ncbi:N-acetylmuramoyl-L-alanine amidase [candidate division KSB1 bacterium]|nr:N-acetylmuramoyl-L-alanine amidase [candidate division KSB1 bacterium]
MAFQIEWIESQFFDPGKIANQMIIVHHTGSNNGQVNSFEGTISWFKPATWRTYSQVSAQYIIAREERPIVQMVRDDDTAWHAGRSEWIIDGHKYTELNNRSIGIELQGDGNLVGYTQFQYEALIWLIRQKMQKYNVPLELVRGHQEISTQKVDPGRLFDWNWVRNQLSSVSVNVPNTPPADVVDSDNDGVVYTDPNHDVYIPDGRDRSLFGRIVEAIFSLFK